MVSVLEGYYHSWMCQKQDERKKKTETSSETGVHKKEWSAQVFTMNLPIWIEAYGKENALKKQWIDGGEIELIPTGSKIKTVGSEGKEKASIWWDIRIDQFARKIKKNQTSLLIFPLSIRGRVFDWEK